jgi:hypothetical protein
VTTFIVNTEADFDLIRTQMGVWNGSAGDLHEVMSTIFSSVLELYHIRDSGPDQRL